MATQANINWVRGETEEWQLFVTDANGSASNLGSILALEVEVKPYNGAPDPATLHLGIGTGITVLDQTVPANLGLANVVVTAAQTFALAANIWHYDVWVTRSDSARKRVTYGVLTVSEVVNFP